MVKRGERKGRGREEEKRERKGKRREEGGRTERGEEGEREKGKREREESKKWAFSSEKSFNFPAVLFCVKTGDFE